MVLIHGIQGRVSSGTLDRVRQPLARAADAMHSPALRVPAQDTPCAPSPDPHPAHRR